MLVLGLEFKPPCSSSCSGSHYLEGCKLQLNPCVFFEECFLLYDRADVGYEYIMDGVFNGFKILDDGFTGSYCCANYDSILDIEFRKQMDSIVREELGLDKVTRVSCVPQCVHSLGAVLKTDGKLRPITNCKRSLGISINNYMTKVCDDFHFIRIDDVTDSMIPGCYFAVVDIKSAYRSVNIYLPQRTFQGFVWNFKGQDNYYIDNCLCFGLKCAPFIFSQLTSFVVRCMRHMGYMTVFGYLDEFLVVGKK